MNSQGIQNTASGSQAAENNAEACHPASKWAATVNDTGIPAPQRRVSVSVLKTQAGVPENHTLFRDYSAKSDVPLGNDAVVDLADGNVFYSRNVCDAPANGSCSGTAKLAWFIDDHHEETLRPDQTVISLKELFQLPQNCRLVRDYESPVDEPLDSDAAVRFEDGPVLITRSEEGGGRFSVTIVVEGTPHVWRKRLISHEEVVKLEVPEYPQSPPFTYAVTYKRGQGSKPEGILALGASVKVKEGMVFNVSETGQS